MVSPQIFDHYGRMLAYVNANYEKADPVIAPKTRGPCSGGE